MPLSLDHADHQACLSRRCRCYGRLALTHQRALDLPPIGTSMERRRVDDRIDTLPRSIGPCAPIRRPPPRAVRRDRRTCLLGWLFPPPLISVGETCAWGLSVAPLGRGGFFQVSSFDREDAGVGSPVHHRAATSATKETQKTYNACTRLQPIADQRNLSSPFVRLSCNEIWDRM
jgi:hypothetical protein